MIVIKEQPTPCDDTIIVDVHVTEDDLSLYHQKQPVQSMSLLLTHLAESAEAPPTRTPLQKEGLIDTRPSCVQCGHAQVKRGGGYDCELCPQPVGSVTLPLTDLAPTTAVDVAMTLDSDHQLGDGLVESRPGCERCRETGLERSAEEDVHICEDCQQMEVMYRPSDILESLSIYDSKDLIIDNAESRTEFNVCGYAKDSKSEEQYYPPEIHIQEGDSTNITELTTNGEARPVLGQFERGVFLKGAFHVKDTVQTIMDSDQESENSKTESHEDLGLVLSL